MCKINVKEIKKSEKEKYAILSDKKIYHDRNVKIKPHVF